MTVVETRMSVWEALAGRAPGSPSGPADPGLWSAVAERLNPARAKPRLRAGIEDAELVSARGVRYVMLRSPDRAAACYLRLTPQEWALARLMDGTRTVARLVAEFARISGRLAPDQVTRVVADLAGNRMLDELPLDAFRPLSRVHRRPWPIRLGRGVLAALRGRRVVLARIDPLVGLLYRAGGRALFTPPAAVLAAMVALTGLSIFLWTWVRADQSVFLTGDSYALGALVLLGLNVLALACHELGHALAAKHAGRSVPAAGFLVYFGIPSVFVDTTDVWMAGRKARLTTTAAGPATGLVLAGAAQIVGFAYPPLAPWTFKLSFAWYLNALFNLNPFLALDGYYLLMDALEVPNLRARGMAWVVARLRRRPPRFGQLDGEGRLVALYGMLSVAWLLIAANLAYRIYTDRVTGLATGLWRSGWPARLLLVAVVAGLAAPLVYVLLGWLGRRARGVRRRLSQRRAAADVPRRLDALRASALGRLPAPALDELARQARWVHPRTGEQLVFAGAAQHDVYVVVDGALEARRPGDPSGTVRERVGAGGIVGLANALSGAAAALAWHTAGTTLLAVPAPAVTAAVGPLPGPPPAERAELDELLATVPALAGLSEEDKLGLASRARPLALPPGAPVIPPGPADAMVVASGIVARPDGSEVRRGGLLGPYGEDLPGTVGTTRTPVRTWTLPAVAGLPLLLGAAPATPSGSTGRPPAFGVHPPTGYPPLAAPPGPPPSDVDGETDRRFERRLWWLLILLLLFGLLLTAANMRPGPAWAEMPSDRALLRVGHGRVIATVGGAPVELNTGAARYVREGDAVAVADRSYATLTFRGGGVALLCADSGVGVGELVSDPTRPIRPNAALGLDRGRMLVNTRGDSTAFAPLALRVRTGQVETANSGAARFAVDPGAARVAEGTVTRDGVPVPPDGAQPTCGDDTGLPGAGSPSASPSPSESPSPSDSPSASPSSPSPSPTKPGPTSPRATRSPTRSPSPSPSPRDTSAPTVLRVTTRDKVFYAVDATGAPCNQSGPVVVHVIGSVSDPDNAPNTLSVRVTYTLNGTLPVTRTVTVIPDATGFFDATIGPVSDAATMSYTSTVDVRVVAVDRAGNTSPSVGMPAMFTFYNCKWG